jgi:hypothetical protein
MLRATVWTVGLFGAGSAICRAYPGTWTEPLVLFALGLALLFVSARTARTAGAAPGARVPAPVAPVASKPAPKAAPVPSVPSVAAAAAQVQVERTA